MNIASLSQDKKLPLSSGVYFFINKKGEILYIGRAISLRKRVFGYFQKNIDPRISEMINLAEKIKYKKTDNLLEAVILEANLIKRYLPKYNVKEKDNRSFIYIVIPKTDYPKLIITRGRELEKFPKNAARIFGPYQSLSLVKNALKIIRQIFPYSACRPLSGQPCFYYQIGLCPGLCIGKITKEEYQKNINNIILLLSGKKKKLISALQKENPEAVKSLKHIQDVSLLVGEKIKKSAAINKIALNKIEGYDISHLSGKEAYGSMAVFIGGESDSSQYRLFKIKNAPASDDLRALEEVLIRRFKHKEWRFPDLILIDGGKPQVEYAFKILKNININIPIVGISKLRGDKLVFPPKTKKSAKELSENAKSILLKIRDEAHRFANKASHKKRLKDGFNFKQKIV